MPAFYTRLGLKNHILCVKSASQLLLYGQLRIVFTFLKGSKKGGRKEEKEEEIIREQKA